MLPQGSRIIQTLNPRTGKFESNFIPQILHVKKTGNDTTGDGSEGNPFLTINKAMSVQVTSGQIWVYSTGAPTFYAENTDTSPYVPTKLFSGAILCGMSALVNGTRAHPCVLRAAPGHEGLVNITGETDKYGLHTNYKDHWSVYGLRCVDLRVNFVGQEGYVAQHGVPLASLADGWSFENILVKGVVGNAGGNSSAFGVWGSSNLVIRDCKIRNISAEGGQKAAGIQMYGTAYGLIENIDMDDCDFGVFLKDHLTESGSAPYNPRPGLEIRYSKIKADTNPIYFSISGTDAAAAGDQYVHHNEIVANDATGGNLVFAEMGGARSQSQKLRISQNSMHSKSSSGGAAFSVNGFKEFENEGNVIVTPGQVITTPYNSNDWTRITKSNRNAYNQFLALLEQYTGNQTSFANITAWRAAVAGTPSTLGISNPDMQSVVSATLYNNAATGDYSLAAGSPAIGLMADGSNAGAYQYGTEVVGLTSSYSVGD